MFDLTNEQEIIQEIKDKLTQPIHSLEYFIRKYKQNGAKLLLGSWFINSECLMTGQLAAWLQEKMENIIPKVEVNLKSSTKRVMNERSSQTEGELNNAQQSVTDSASTATISLSVSVTI